MDFDGGVTVDDYFIYDNFRTYLNNQSLEFDVDLE